MKFLENIYFRGALLWGGMAEVFLSRNHGAAGISKFSAIKRILPQFSANKDFVRMFKDEAKINMNLSHGNIVSIYDFGEEQESLLYCYGLH